MANADAKVAFAGTGTFAAAVLNGLQRRGIAVALIITQPSPPGRPSPVASFAASLAHVPLRAPGRIAELDAALAAFDLLLVADYGQIIPPRTRQAPRRGALNVHPSLLPRDRGPSPIQATLRNGDAAAGVTIMVLDDQVDHGPVVAQRPHPLTGRETTPELEAALAADGVALLADSLAPYLAGTLAPQPQDHAQATYTKRLTRADGKLDWAKPAVELERLVRALQPWPGVWFETLLRGVTRRCKLTAASLWAADVPLLPVGTFFWSGGKLGLTCTGGALEVAELQLAGSKAMRAEAFYRGYHDAIRAVPSPEPAK